MTKEKTSALYSRYIIDGVKMDVTPGQALEAVSEQPCTQPPILSEGPVIVDESVGAGLTPLSFDPARTEDYLSLVLNTPRSIRMPFSETCTKALVAKTLIDALWREGSFKLGDLALKICWKWDEKPVGNMAAFYFSALAAADYIDSLGLKIAGYSYSKASKSGITVEAALRMKQDEDEFLEIPYSSPSPVLKKRRSPGATLVPDPQSWIVYIPFETAEYRFGGSILSQALGLGGVSLNIGDADYFIDCYEVLRELVEDGILLSAQTVGDGGLLAAVKRMCSPQAGAAIDVSDVSASASENDMMRILFAEVPGVVVQIRDIDFDYLDAELLLQDVAFFPLGHPVPGNDGVRVRAGAKSGIQKILESLIQNQCGEGED